MNDIISTMFNKKFLAELFKPQELYSKKALRTVYDRLAHASIMRLNQASMDKVAHASAALPSCPSPGFVAAVNPWLYHSGAAFLVKMVLGQENPCWC